MSQRPALTFRQTTPKETHMCTPLNTRRDIDDHISVCDEHGKAWWTCTRSHAGMGWVTAGGGAKDEADARARLANHDAEYHGQITRDCPICRDHQVEDTDRVFTATGTREEVDVMLRDHILESESYPHDEASVVEYLLKEVK